MDSKYISQRKQLAMGKSPSVAKTAKASSMKSNIKSSGKKMSGMSCSKGNACC